MFIRSSILRTMKGRLELRLCSIESPQLSSICNHTVTPESDDMCLDRQTGPHVQVVTVAFIASTFFRCRFRPCVSARKAFFIGVKVASPKALNDRK
jgi:hypothetical protein